MRALFTLLGMTLWGCAEPSSQTSPGPIEDRQTAAAPASQTADGAPSAAAPATAPHLASADAPPELSGSAPPEPPPPPAREPGKLADARKAEIASQVDQLELQMLAALSARPSGPNDVLSRNDVPLSLLDNAVRSAPRAGGGDLRELGSGSLRAGSGGGAGLASLGDVSKPRTLGGATLEKATSEHVHEALRQAGCSNITSSALPGDAGSSLSLFTAKCFEKNFTITFAPKGSRVPSELSTAISQNGAVLREGGAFVGVVREDNDAASARRLLRRLTRKD